MKGQRLFVRPIEEGDTVPIREFHEAHGCPHAVPESGLVGKLVGDLVAVLGISLETPATVRIDSLVVAAELRRKRIGRFMLEELAQLARKMERDRIVAGEASAPAEFLRKLGFIAEGTQWIRRID
jgi:N-acetylglutamate synthase-like GNAT family acetyltransferase